jgi:phosphoglycolate phosphatase
MAFDLVLFDLDGTLLDTAPDLGAALNRLRAEQGRPPLPDAAIRPYVSRGAPGLLQLGLGITREDPRFADLRARLLELYAEHIAELTRPFPGVPALLAQLTAEDTPWGIVTNKPGSLTEPLLAGIPELAGAATVVSGDTLAQHKPDPAPVLHACTQAGIAPKKTVFFGDDRRDVEAGRAAGTATAVALYGYIPDEDDPYSWGADGHFQDVPLFAAWLENARLTQGGAP